MPSTHQSGLAPQVLNFHIKDEEASDLLISDRHSFTLVQNLERDPNIFQFLCYRIHPRKGVSVLLIEFVGLLNLNRPWHLNAELETLFQVSRLSLSNRCNNCISRRFKTGLVEDWLILNPHGENSATSTGWLSLRRERG